MSETNEGKSAAPPPPPPPTLLFPQQAKLSPLTLSTRAVTKVDEDELEFALNRLPSCGNFKVFYKCNTSVTPQLQDGPKCGLVALSIATSAGDNFVKVDNIFQTAVSHGLTKQGEMFSAESLAFLAETCCGFKTRVIKGGLGSHLQCIVTSLLKNCLLLVPYDSDFNHAPCCKKGTKAHWAVITGFVIIKQTSAKDSKQNDDFVKITSKCLSSCKCPNTNSDSPLTLSFLDEAVIIGKESLKIPDEYVEEGKVYLIGIQGKSRHIGLWLFDEMASSNDNLCFFPKNEISDGYVLPEGGVEEGLKGKAVFLDCCL